MYDEVFEVRNIVYGVEKLLIEAAASSSSGLVDFV